MRHRTRILVASGIILATSAFCGRAEAGCRNKGGVYVYSGGGGRWVAPAPAYPVQTTSYPVQATSYPVQATSYQVMPRSVMPAYPGAYMVAPVVR